MTKQHTIHMSRRKFLKASVVTVGALSFSFAFNGIGSALVQAATQKPMLDFDILIIGSGGAGLRAAAAALEANPKARVCVVTKVMPSRCATCMAEGGINGVVDFSKGDSYELHAFDTIKGGDYLVDQDAAMLFAEEAGKAILEMDYLGTPFSRDAEGRAKARPFGGASKVRCHYSADKTGHILAHACLDSALSRGVKFMMDYQLLDLGVADGAVEGAVLRNIRTGDILPVRAKSVVLCTGGYTRIFWNRTSTPYISTGDGVAAAMRAGAPFKDPEMLQFHPTGVVHGGVLITEAARGEGGYLLNNKGERFMARYAKGKMELAPRDIVARAIETEIQEGRGFGEGMEAYVQLDLRHLGRDKIVRDLPQIRHVGKLFEGIDLVDEPIIIRPTAHYSMGGIDIADFNTMSTVVKGLFAAGEASNISIHGANRLGGNSLADAVVTGKLAGLGAAKFISDRKDMPEGKSLMELSQKWADRYGEVTARKGETPIFALREKMGTELWENMGIFRSGDKLAALNAMLVDLEKEYLAASVPNANPVYNTLFTQYVELGNMIACARAAALGAEQRLESRGAHTRLDYPNRDDARFLKHSMVSLNTDGSMKLDWKDATITKFKPEERKY